jgi:hypothetical protein
MRFTVSISACVSGAEPTPDALDRAQIAPANRSVSRATRASMVGTPESQVPR